jgi:tetratricopeptide repeat protein
MTAVPGASDGQLMSRAVEAFRRGDFRAAVARYSEVLAQPNQPPELRGTALLSRAMAHQLLGELSTAFSDVIAALDTWKSAPAAWLAGALTEIAAALTPETPAIAEDYWRAASALATRSGDNRLTAIVIGEQGRQLGLAGNLDGARARFAEAEELARRAGDDRTAATALVNMARVYVESGQRGEAARSVAEALALSASGSHVEAAAAVLIDLAVLALNDGQMPEAELYLEQVVALGDAVDSLLRERAMASLAGVAKERRDLNRAMRLGDELVGQLKAEGDSTAVAELLHDLGVTALAAARGDVAEDKLLDSMIGARRHRLAALGASTSRALALVASRRGNHLRALGYAEQAMVFSLDSLEREACAITLAMVASEAERWQRFDISTAAHADAADIYRELGRAEQAAAHEAAGRAAREADDAGAQRSRTLDDSVRMARDIVGPE